MIDVTRDGAVATVRMDHGPVNAADLEFLEAVTAAITELGQDDTVASIVLAGNDRAFGAGVDLRRILDGGEPYTRDFLDALSRFFLAPIRTVAPVVAAVTGHAVAGGAVLAACCDHAVMTDDERARIGLAELTVGVPFPTIAIAAMRRRLGPGLARAVWTAGLFGPVDALAQGFVDEVVPADEVVARATDHATRLAALPAITRKLAHEQLVADVEAFHAAHHAEWDPLVHDAWCSDEVRGAIAAYVERTLR